MIDCLLFNTGELILLLSFLEIEVGVLELEEPFSTPLILIAAMFRFALILRAAGSQVSLIFERRR